MLRPPHGLTVIEAFRLGYVPPMAGAAGEENGGAPEGGAATAESQGSELYREHLANVPEDLHPFVTDTFRKWDAQVTPKLQEAAQLRDRYSPYESIDGFSDIEPDELAELVTFRNQILGDPEQLKQWVANVGEELGVGGDLSRDDWIAMGQSQGWLDGDEGLGEEEGGFDVDSFKRELLEELRGELEPVKQFMGRSESEKAAEQAKQQFSSRLSELEGQHGELDDDGRSHVLELARNYLDDDDPIGKAFERHLKITGKAEGALVDGKLSQPGGALNGGRPSTEPPKTSWHDGVSPRELALARVKGG
jgi:hypothetical protein